MKSFTGINIQFPISRLILDGKKTVETRTYPLPKQYIGKEMVIIETPGPVGKFESRIVGIIVFSKCFKYETAKKFYADVARHHVYEDSPWSWNPAKPKWGWEISRIRVFPEHKKAPNRKGIVYTKDISLPSF